MYFLIEYNTNYNYLSKKEDCKLRITIITSTVKISNCNSLSVIQGDVIHNGNVISHISCRVMLHIYLSIPPR